MPEDGINLVDHSQVLSYKEIVEFTKIAVSKGINKVRITGGEPLIRRDITTLISMLSEIDGIEDLSMTTNGTLLSDLAFDLKSAGLDRVNISLDTTDPEKYKAITRGGDINKVFEGIESAKRAGLNPIKINCVVENNREEKDALNVTEFALSKGLMIRFIPLMNLKNGQFGRVDGGEGGNCSSCNRLRLTATGKLKPCLFSDLEFDVRELGFEQAIAMALEKKPLKGGTNNSGCFYNIGG